jgi:hypothetical protein
MIKREIDGYQKRQEATSGSALINQLDSNELCDSITTPNKRLSFADRALGQELFTAGFLAEPEDPKLAAMAKLKKNVEEAFQKRKFDEAEKHAKDLVALCRANFDKDDTSKLLGPQILLARSLAAQNKCATAEYDEALRLAQLKDQRKPNFDIAQLYSEKGDNLLTYKEDGKDKEKCAKEAVKALTEGIKLLDAAQPAERLGNGHIFRNWLYYDLYDGRASAKIVLKDSDGASKDKGEATKHKDQAELWGPRGWVEKK